MKIKDKILVIFETSTIRNPDHAYGEMKFGKTFEAIKEYLLSKGIEDRVQLGVTRFSIDEISQGRREDFLKDRKELERFKGLPGVRLPQGSFDYNGYLKAKVDLFLKRSNILVIPYPHKSHLYKLLRRSLLKRRPFTQTNNHSDYGFKDAIIWESILGFKKARTCKKIIFVSNDKAFDEECAKEFADIHGCYFRIYKDYAEVVKDLEDSLAIEDVMKVSEDDPSLGVLTSSLAEDHLKKLIKSDYFKDSILQFIKGGDKKIDIKKINRIAIQRGQQDIDDVDSIKIFTYVEVEVEGGIRPYKVLTLLDDALGIEDHEFYE